jgi:hypothetical protein
MGGPKSVLLKTTFIFSISGVQFAFTITASSLKYSEPINPGVDTARSFLHFLWL